MDSSLRPKGTVEVDCACGWSFWIDALDPRLPSGPFVCPSCEGTNITKKATQAGGPADDGG